MDVIELILLITYNVVKGKTVVSQKMQIFAVVALSAFCVYPILELLQLSVRVLHEGF